MLYTILTLIYSFLTFNTSTKNIQEIKKLNLIFKVLRYCSENGTLH